MDSPSLHIDYIIFLCTYWSNKIMKNWLHFMGPNSIQLMTEVLLSRVHKSKTLWAPTSALRAQPAPRTKCRRTGPNNCSWSPSWRASWRTWNTMPTRQAKPGCHKTSLSSDKKSLLVIFFSCFSKRLLLNYLATQYGTSLLKQFFL